MHALRCARLHLYTLLRAHAPLVYALSPSLVHTLSFSCPCTCMALPVHVLTRARSYLRTPVFVLDLTCTRHSVLHMLLLHTLNLYTLTRACLCLCTLVRVHILTCARPCLFRPFVLHAPSWARSLVCTPSLVHVLSRARAHACTSSLCTFSNLFVPTFAHPLLCMALLVHALACARRHDLCTACIGHAVECGEYTVRRVALLWEFLLFLLCCAVVWYECYSTKCSDKWVALPRKSSCRILSKHTRHFLRHLECWKFFIDYRLIGRVLLPWRLSDESKFPLARRSRRYLASNTYPTCIDPYLVRAPSFHVGRGIEQDRSTGGPGEAEGPRRSSKARYGTHQVNIWDRYPKPFRCRSAFLEGLAKTFDCKRRASFLEGMLSRYSSIRSKPSTDACLNL